MNDKQIKALNMVIESAIQHGGDYGSAYCCYPDELAETMDALVASFGDGYYWKWDNPTYQDVLLIYRK